LMLAIVFFFLCCLLVVLVAFVLVVFVVIVIVRCCAQSADPASECAPDQVWIKMLTASVGVLQPNSNHSNSLLSH